MKRVLLSIAFLLTVMVSFSQDAIKPVVMVVPDDIWCKDNHYVDELGNPDYQKAVSNNNMNDMVYAMGNIMEKRGYPIVSMKEKMDQSKKEEALDMVLTSEAKGEIVETDLDKLTRAEGVDILIKLSYVAVRQGPRNMFKFSVGSVDAGTAKLISGESGTCSASADMNSLLNEAVVGFMDNFCYNLDLHFKDMEKNGREGSVIFKMANDCPFTFTSTFYYMGESGSLSELIEYWLNEHTVNGAFRKSGKARNRLAFDQVRFPLFSGNGKWGAKPKALDMEGFIAPIADFLLEFGISCYIQPLGTGMAYVVLGGAN